MANKLAFFVPDRRILKVLRIPCYFKGVIVFFTVFCFLLLVIFLIGTAFFKVENMRACLLCFQLSVFIS